MTKKKVLFVIRNLNVGGVEKSLISLLRALPPDRYDIDLGVINAEGGFADHIPPHARVFEIESLHKNYVNLTGRFKAITHNIARHNFKDALAIPFLYLKSRISDTLIPLYSYFIKENQDKLPEYDVAVAFQGPSELIDYYVSHVVKAKKKFGWIHFDVENFFIRKGTTNKCYNTFERIMVVSRQGKESFDRVFPSLSEKTEVMLNIIDRDEIIRLSRKENVYGDESDSLKICTVGRLARIKGQDLAIEAAQILKDRGIKFKWYLVGDGEKREEYEQLAKKLEVEEHVVFLGATPNPYPYIAGSDVYVQTSRSDGYCIALGEAKLFGTPIVCTDFLGAHEQLDNVSNAIIIRQWSPVQLAEAVIKVSEIGHIVPEYEGNPPQIERIKDLFG